MSGSTLRRRSAASSRWPFIRSHRAVSGRRTMRSSTMTAGIAEREYETPALGRREGRADEVGEGDTRGGSYLEGDEHRAPDPDWRRLGNVGRRHDYGDADGEAEEEPDHGQEPLVGGQSLQTGERRVAEGDQHERALAPYGVGDPPREERPEQLAEHHRRGHHRGHESGEVEGRDEEQERARDRAKVVAVDQADDRGRNGDEDVEPRNALPACCPSFHGNLLSPEVPSKMPA